MMNSALGTITTPFLFLILVLGLSFNMTAQQSDVIQLSGQVFVDEDGELLPLPYVSVYIAESNRGTFTDEQGFFSIVGEKGETVIFNGLGLEEAKFVIPDTLQDNRYSVIQLMTADLINLPETVIYPWPSKEHFKIEFLALDVSNPLLEVAKENLSQENMEQVESTLYADGAESAKYYFNKQAQEYYSVGQAKPQNIFSPLAWAKFFQAWKRGDFKRKE